jgi:CRP-like cAMP-binding protein
MSILLDLCSEQPVRRVLAGEVLVVEGERTGVLFVVRNGEFEVTRQGSSIARITEPGSVIGEISVLLTTAHGASVTATAEGEVHVVGDPAAFLSDGAASVEVARILAARLNRLVAYLADVRAQYGNAGGHLELLDEILGELSFGAPPSVDPGSEREPDPYY